MNNIGIVSTWYERGAGYVSNAYYEALTTEANVYIYARGNEKNLIKSYTWNQKYVTWGKQIHLGVPTFIIWSDFKKWIIQNKIDIIIFNEQQSWDVIIRCQKLNVKIGAYVDYYTPETVPLFWLYDFLICNTKRHYNVFRNHPQAIYIPWGTNCEVFKPSTSKSNKVIFFHSCGMSPYRKGTDLLIEAFSKINGQCELIIHTQVKFEEFDFSTIIDSDKRVRVIHGTIPPPGLFHLGDAYIYPTRLEGIGLTIVEALACGLPVITTDNPPMNEFVAEKENGFLIPVQKFQLRKDNYYWAESICDKKQLTEIMQYLVDNPSSLKELKLQARSSAEKKFNWKHNSVDLAEKIFLFKKTIKPKKLLFAACLYEYKRYPGLAVAALMKKFNKNRK